MFDLLHADNPKNPEKYPGSKMSSHSFGLRCIEGVGVPLGGAARQATTNGIG